MPIQYNRRAKSSASSNSKNTRQKLELTCPECRSKIGPLGCCNQIRKLSRQISYAAVIARETRTEISAVIKKFKIINPKLKIILKKLRDLT
jgi:hypothetical protein